MRTWKSKNHQFGVLSSLILLNKEHFSIRLWHVTKSGFYTTGNDQLSGWTVKKFQSISQRQTCSREKKQTNKTKQKKHISQLPLLQASLQLLQGKWFYNKQEAKNAFQDFIKSWSTDIYAIEINLFLTGKNVLIIMILNSWSKTIITFVEIQDLMSHVFQIPFLCKFMHI